MSTETNQAVVADDQHAPEHVTEHVTEQDQHLDPWAHVRSHAAEGGLYATCITQLCDHVNKESQSTADCIIDLRQSVQLLVDALGNAAERLKALEAKPEVKVLPTADGIGDRTLLVPVQPQKSTSLNTGLLRTVNALIANGIACDRDEELISIAVLQATAKWFEQIGGVNAARCLREELGS